MPLQRRMSYFLGAIRAACRSSIVSKRKDSATAPVTRRTGSRAFGLRTFALQKGRELPLPEVLCSRSDAGRTYSARRYSGMLDGIVVRLRKPIARLSRSSPSALRQSSVSFCVIFRSVCCDGMAPNPTSQTGPKSGVHFSQHSHAQNEQLKRGHTKQQNCDCDPIIFEPMPAHCMHGLPSLLRDSPATLAHAISQESILVSRFVVKTRPTFRSLWRKSGMVIDSRRTAPLAAMQRASVGGV
jgi:hypothetical protein